MLVLAARGADGAFQVTYPGEDGTALVISQDPPNRRIDVVAGDRVVQSRVFRGGVGYECEPPEDDPAGALECSRAQGALEAPGAFTDEALDAFTDELADSTTRSTCPSSAHDRRGRRHLPRRGPEAGPTDGTGPGVETICLSDEGGQLLVDVGGERLVADGVHDRRARGDLRDLSDSGSVACRAMDEPEQWRWIWLGAAVLFGIGEMATPGAFFLAPFAIGAVVASALAFADVGLAGEWAAFVGISVAAFAALRRSPGGSTATAAPTASARGA